MLIVDWRLGLAVPRLCIVRKSSSIPLKSNFWNCAGWHLLYSLKMLSNCCSKEGSFRVPSKGCTNIFVLGQTASTLSCNNDLSSLRGREALLHPSFLSSQCAMRPFREPHLSIAHMARKLLGVLCPFVERTMNANTCEYRKPASRFRR